MPTRRFIRNLLFLSAPFVALTACDNGQQLATQQPLTSITPEVITIKQDKVDWWDTAVFYEIWPRSFYDTDGDGSGDFNGMTAKLDYLTDLGVNGIWLTPIFEAPSYHGYDFQDFYAVESDYGSMQDFENFMAEAHKRDIKVILDLVINHISSGHEWFQKSAAREAGFEDYFIWKDQRPAKWGKAWSQDDEPEAVWHWNEQRQQYYYGAFGASQPDVNLTNPVVIAEMKKMADFWLQKGVDGFRLDAVRYAVEVEQGEDAIQADSDPTIAYWRDFTAHVKSVNSEALLVAEAWADMPTKGKYWDQGKGLDSAFDFDFGYVVTGILNNDAKPQADFGTLKEEDSGKTRDALWQNLKDRQASAELLFYSPFLTNHDQERVMYTLENSHTKAKIAASLLMTTPGSVYIYYGEEIGMSQFTTGDDQFRRAIMQWADDPENAGFNQTGQFWPDQAKWFPWMQDHQPWWQAYWQGLLEQGGHSVQAQAKDADSLLNHYKALIAARMALPALHLPTEMRFYPVNSPNVWLLETVSGDASNWVVINLSDDQAVSFQVPASLQGEQRDALTQQAVMVGSELSLAAGQTFIF